MCLTRAPGHLKKPQSWEVEPTAGTEGSCNHSKTGRNSCHQAWSRKNTWLRRIGWSSWRKTHSRLIIQRKKEYDLAGMLKVTYQRLQFLRLHQRFCDQSSTKVILSTLFWGRRACRLRESSSMRGMVRDVDGPSCLSRWREMPSLEKQSIDLFRLCWQTEEPEGPRVWKSSR